MLFWCFVGLLVLGIVSLIVANTKWSYHNDVNDIFTVLGAVFTIFGVIAVIVSLLIIGIEHTASEGYVASLTEERNAIVYQFENDVYDNDNDIGKRELMTEIRDWNMKIAKWSKHQDNFWIGIYYADIYDQFELIRLEE